MPDCEKGEIIHVKFHEITANYGDSIQKVFTVRMEPNQECFQLIGPIATVKILAALSRAVLFSIARKLPHSFHVTKIGACAGMMNIMLDNLQRAVDVLPNNRDYLVKPETQLYNIKLKIERRIIPKEVLK
jgi:hypothetical protein